MLRCRQAGRLCKTKPIPGSWTAVGWAVVPNKANLSGGAERDAAWGMRNRVSCTNKPNSECPAARRVVIGNKQSQFPARYVARASCPWISSMGGTPMPRRRRPVAIVRTKANFGRLGRHGPAVAAPNKANSAEVEGWASTRWRRSYGQLNMQKVSMKQSQYAPGEGIGGASPARGCNCAKQTQFRPAGGQQAASRGGPFVRNKANLAWSHSPTGCDGVKQTQFKPGGRYRGAESAKQSRFAPAQGDRWGKPHPTRGCNCVKQSQFRPASGQQATSRGGPFVRNKANFAGGAGRDAA